MKLNGIQLLITSLCAKLLTVGSQGGFLLLHHRQTTERPKIALQAFDSEIGHDSLIIMSHLDASVVCSEWNSALLFTKYCTVHIVHCILLLAIGEICIEHQIFQAAVTLLSHEMTIHLHQCKKNLHCFNCLNSCEGNR